MGDGLPFEYRMKILYFSLCFILIIINKASVHSDKKESIVINTPIRVQPCVHLKTKESDYSNNKDYQQCNKILGVVESKLWILVYINIYQSLSTGSTYQNIFAICQQSLFIGGTIIPFRVVGM